jgi:lambda family phage portal protein
VKALESFIESISPKWAAMRGYWRQRASAMRFYEAGQASIYRKQPGAHGSPDSTMEKARTNVRDWARHLDENLDLGIGLLDDLVNKIVGTGIVIEPNVTTSTGKPRKKLNRDIAKALRQWCRNPEVTGEMHFGEAQRQMVRAWLRDGEMLIQHVSGSRGRIQHFGGVPYSLEMIEADFLPFDVNDESLNIIHGVQKNAWGRPRAYWLLKNAPDNSFLKRQTADEDLKRVPADRMTHLKFTRRIKQTRGISIFHGVAHRLEDIKDIEDSERIAAKVDANLTAFIRKGADFDITKTIDENGDALPERRLKMQAGMIFDKLLPGEDVGTIASNRPNNGVTEFRKGQLKAVAAGTGTSYSSIARDYDGTYSSQRQERVELEPAYGKMRDYFIWQVLQVIYQHFIDAAILSGAVTVPASVELEDLYQCIYIAPPLPWVDPDKESKADERAVLNGFKTRQHVIRERTGRDPTEVMEQTQLEMEIPTPNSKASETAAAAPASTSAAGGDDSPPPGDNAAGDDDDDSEANAA